jgi:voltage-gated potassium channel
VTGKPTPHTVSTMRSVVEAVLVMALATVAFFVLPVPAMSLDRVVIVTVVFLVGVAGAAALIVRQVINFRLAAQDGQIRFRGLLIAIYVTVLFFALSYYVLETTHEGQFAKLDTRMDALYLSMSNVSTVGFGDVHADGQAARAIVTLQMVFNLLFVSLALSAARAPVSAHRPDVP